MQYSKLATLCAFALTGALMATGAQAADTTINITATVTATPCTVTTTPTVNIGFDLGAAEVALANTDSSAGVETSIMLTGCPATTKSVEATFVGPDVAGDVNGYGMKGSDGKIATTGSIRLTNMADNIQIDKANNKYTVIPAADGSAEFKLRAYMRSITGGVLPDTYTTPIEVTYAYH